MVFAGPTEWAEARELEWERDALVGMADQDSPDELHEREEFFYRAARAARRGHPEAPVPSYVLRSAA